MRRRRLRELRHWLEAFDETHPSEHVLERYATATARERAGASRNPGWAIGRRLRFQRTLPAGVSDVWARWTRPAQVRQWWSPEHFTVAECDIDPVPGGRLDITMQEADGSRYPSRGHFLTVTPPRQLRFELSHLAASGTPLFTAIHDLHLTDHGQRTQLNLAIRITAASPAAAPAIAGLQPGWEQLLSKLARTLIPGAQHRPPRQTPSGPRHDVPEDCS